MSIFPFADLDRLKADLDALRPLAPKQEVRVVQEFLELGMVAEAGAPSA